MKQQEAEYEEKFNNPFQVGGRLGSGLMLLARTCVWMHGMNAWMGWIGSGRLYIVH